MLSRSPLRVHHPLGLVVILLAITLMHAGCGSAELAVLQDGPADVVARDGGRPGGDADAADDADDAVDAKSPRDGATFACGTETCGAAQYCLNPCCGGAPPQCLPKSGACPVGFHDAACGGQAGCEADPCTPPPARCIDDPVNDGTGCTVSGRQLTCHCA